MPENAGDRAAELSPLKRALLEIREMRTQLDDYEAAHSEPIAVIGMGMRFPGGVNSPESYWSLLENGVSGIRDIPTERWDAKTYFDPDPTAPGKMYTRGGGFIDGVDEFDPAFFGISPREALSMDPQQRLLLEVVWEALERAGQAPDKLDGSKTGVFIGIGNSDYSRITWADTDNIDVYFATGSSYSVASGRISYTLGLQGPSLSIDTACSSSLVAAHLAVQSLRSGESNMAVVGGVNLILMPEANITFSKAQMMAVDDQCKTFDAAADGYVRGEGCGIIVLKRLSDAIANHDNIQAVILGSAVNQDGRSSGLTAPNGPSQEAVIRTALINSHVTPDLVAYVEAHGTGTPLGDPIEVQALAAALGDGHTKENPLLVGAVKTNVGHLEAASGIAGLMKVALMLQHGQIVPHLHLNELNPYIPWAEIPLQVTTETIPFPQREGRQIAGVSSFGFSGTNAHIILETAPVLEATKTEVERPLHLMTLSARRDDALVDLAQQFAGELAQNPQQFADIAFTANVGRAHLTHRLAMTAESAAEAQEKLAAFIGRQEAISLVANQLVDTRAPEIAFLFTGHGAQYEGMGRVLYETQPTFRAAIDECTEVLSTYDVPLKRILFAEAGEPSLMDKMIYAQPALFSLEYALAKLWISWGVRPTTVMGHSVGEYAAACIAGLFSLADGLKLVVARGRLFDSLTEPGQMVAVFAPEEQVSSFIAPYASKVSIGAVNGATNIVISGAIAVLETILAELNNQGIKFRKLDIPQSSHSPLLDPILDEFERVAGEITYFPPQIGLISDVSGELAGFAEVGNAAYWRRHLRQPVRYAASIETLHREGYKVFLEIGPNPTLLGMGRRCLPADYGLWFPSLRQGWNDWAQMLESLSALYVNGADVDWSGFDADYMRQRLPLPTYPWKKEHYWYENISVKQPARKVDARAVWQSLTEAAAQQAQQAPLDMALSTYPARWQSLDHLTLAYIVKTLQQFGLFAARNEQHTLEDVLAQAHITRGYKSLIARWLTHLVDEKMLAQDGEQFVSFEPLPSVSLEAAWADVQTKLADIQPLIDYLRRCGDHLSPILTNQYSPLETLFPGGSFTTTTFIYNTWSIIRYFNNIARAAITAAITRLGGRQLRVLEIGAGTGGLSAAILPAFPPDRTAYFYTDVSDFFLGHAEQKFSGYPFIHYGLLNIEQSPEEQGYPYSSFDLIVAANSLHATKDLGQTLDHVRSLLAPGGLLVLYEGTVHQSWFDMTTGLIEGWGRFEDDIRGDNPLLTPPEWQSVLLGRGFERVAYYPEEASEANMLRQSVIVAQSPEVGQRVEVSISHADTVSATTEAAAGPLPEDFRLELAGLIPDDRREQLIVFVRGRVARILRLASPESIDQRHRLMDLGVDSLMAVELRNAIDTGLGMDGNLPATLIFDYPTVEAIVNYLDLNLFSEPEQSADETQSKPVAEAQSVTNLEELSDDEVAALLMKKLGDI